MKETGILFSGPMVNAILADKKWVTRRTRGLDVINRNPDSWSLSGAKITGPHCFWVQFSSNAGEDGVKCPYGESGSRLWVRETHGIFSTDTGSVSVGYKARLPQGKTIFDTDGGLDVIRPGPEACAWAEGHIDTERWRPSIFMPKWASRITLEITHVRVERLQTISEENVQAEGIEPSHYYCDEVTGHHCDAVAAFQNGWDELNSKRGFGWRINPWVWVIEFKRVQ